MAQEPAHLAAMESAGQLFGAELRHWRLAQGLSQRQLGSLTNHSDALISKVEKGIRRPSLEFAQRMDKALTTDGALERLWPRLSEQHHQAEKTASDEVDLDELVGRGLEWASTEASVHTVIDLWRAEMTMDRRAVLLNAAWSAAALTTPALRWLDQPTDLTLARTAGRQVSAADVDALWSMARSFADIDHQMGGGYARGTLIQFLDNVVGHLLKGSFSDDTGRALYAAAGRLSNLAGFMAFDSGRHGLGQRYYIQALRLTKASGDQILGAHILTDMSMQSHHLGKLPEARALAIAASRAANAGGSPATAARAAALEARAAAAAGDRAGADHAMTTAETQLSRAHRDEPAWIGFFTDEQLATEHMYVSHALGRTRDVQRYASQASIDATVRSSPRPDGTPMNRRHVLASAALADSHLDTDVDHACEVLRGALPAAAGLTSNRGLEAVNAVRRRLRPHQDRPAVQQVEAELSTLLAG